LGFFLFFCQGIVRRTRPRGWKQQGHGERRGESAKGPFAPGLTHFLCDRACARAGFDASCAKPGCRSGRLVFAPQGAIMTRLERRPVFFRQLALRWLIGFRPVMQAWVNGQSDTASGRAHWRVPDPMTERFWGIPLRDVMRLPPTIRAHNGEQEAVRGAGPGSVANRRR